MPIDSRLYRSIISHYEGCLAQHGDSHAGVDWPAIGVQTRYRIMLELMQGRNRSCALLDLGCGASHLYEYILASGLDHIDYSGLDLSEQFVALSRRKFPGITYYCGDILKGIRDLPKFDYVIMNGVFTEKRELSFDDMFEYVKAMLRTAFSLANRGIAFNVMSKHVDWERDDLFHLPFDSLATFLSSKLTRNFIIRNDYGLYEYTVYAYKRPS